MKIEKVEVNAKSESWETFTERNGLPKKITVEAFNDEESLKGLDKIVESSYPDIIAKQLCSVQPIDTSVFKSLFFQSKEEKQAYYDSLPQWVKDIKQAFKKGDLFLSCYDNGNQIVYISYDKHFDINKIDEEIINESQTSTCIINDYCKNHNLEIKPVVCKIHDFFKGWFKELQFEIKEKK